MRIEKTTVYNHMITKTKRITKPKLAHLFDKVTKLLRELLNYMLYHMSMIYLTLGNKSNLLLNEATNIGQAEIWIYSLITSY